jgi:transporter family-2 protein
MKLVFAFLVVLAGVGTVIQTGMNMQLLAALTNFCVGFFVLALAIFLCRIPLPTLSSIGGTPAWAWLGGLFGAFFIGTLAVAGRELGGVVMVALIVTGQLLAALVFDHYGWLGFPVRPLSLSRIIGSVLLVTSLILFKES